MGKTLRSAHFRRKRRSLPCRRFCSCCSGNASDVCRKSCTNSVRKKRNAIKQKRGTGRILKASKASSVKVSKNRQKIVGLNEGNVRTNRIDVQLKKGIVNVTRLSEDVLNILSEFGSICACEVDLESVCYHSSPRKSVKSPVLTPTRRLRSTPIQPVDRHTPSRVMDKLRVLSSDWRSTSCPLSVNCGPSFSSKAPEKAPGLNMKTLFLENLSICKKTPNYESAKENVTMQNENGRGDNSHKTGTAPSRGKVRVVPPKIVKVFRSPALGAGMKSLLPKAPSKVHHTGPFATTQSTPRNESRSEETRICSRTKIPTPSPNWKPKILGFKSQECGKSNLQTALQTGKRVQNNFVHYTSYIQRPTIRGGNAYVNRRKQSLNCKPVTDSSKSWNDKAFVSESSERTVSLRDKTPPDADDCESPPKRQRIQDLQGSSVSTSETTDADKTSTRTNQVHTIVLSDSSDDEHSYVQVKNVSLPKLAAKPNPVRKPDVLKRSPKMSRADSIADRKISATRAAKNSPSPRVAIKKGPQRRNVAKKNSKANIQVSDSDEYGSDSIEPPKSGRARRTRGSWNGGCRSCPGCQIDAPRKHKPKKVPVKKYTKPESYSSDSEVEVINILMRKPRGPVQKPESPPTVILHGLTSSEDSLDGITDGNDLGDGRTALVVLTGPPGCKEIPPTVRTTRTITIPKQALDLEEPTAPGSPALPSISATTAQNLVETNDLPTIHLLDDTIHSRDSEEEPARNSEERKRETDYDQSVFGTDSLIFLVSPEESKCLKVQERDSVEMVCHEDDTLICLPGVKDDSKYQCSLNSNVSPQHIHLVSSEDVKLSNDVGRPDSQFEEIPQGQEVREHPSCESESSIGTENLDSHDYSESDCSSRKLPSEEDPISEPDLSSACELYLNGSETEHGDVLLSSQTSHDHPECPGLGNTVGGVNGVVSDSQISLDHEPISVSENSSDHNSLNPDTEALPVMSLTQSADVDGGVDSPESDDVTFHNTHDFPVQEDKPESSASDQVLQNGVAEMVAIDQSGIAASDLDSALKDTDKSKKECDDILARTNGETQDFFDHASLPVNQSEPNGYDIPDDISRLLNDCLNDLVESVKLENREVIIRKANPSSETVDRSEATTELPSSEESESLAKELHLLVPLNPRLMIKKLPLLHDGHEAPEVIGKDSKSPDMELPSENDTIPDDRQVPENEPRSTPDMTTPTKSLYELKGYPTPIKKLNPNVLSVIKYNELEIDNDEPSLNDPPETDFVECVSSKGVRFELNPEDLSTIEYFLNMKLADDGPGDQSPESTEAEANRDISVDDLVIDNDEPPLNPSPMKGNHPQPLLENDEDLEDLVIDNDAPPLNEPAAAESKPVISDSDCLIISSDDEVLPSSGENQQTAAPPIAPVSRPRKKLFQRRRNIVGSLPISRNRPCVLPKLHSGGREHSGGVSQTCTLDISCDDLNEVVINDCGIETKRQASGKPLPPFGRPSNWLNHEDPVGMQTAHGESRQRELREENVPLESTSQLFDLDDLEFLSSDIVDEVVIDDSVVAPSWKPSRLEGCHETLLQPQVFNLHGQPFKLDGGHFRDPSRGNSVTASQVTIDLSETFKADSEDLNITGSASDDADVIVVSPPLISSTVNKNVVYNRCDSKDSSHVALSDSDDDLILVSGPDKFPPVNDGTRNFKPAPVNPPVQFVNLSPQVSHIETPSSDILQTSFSGARVRSVPTGNGSFYYVVVAPPSPLQLFSS